MCECIRDIAGIFGQLRHISEVVYALDFGVRKSLLKYLFPAEKRDEVVLVGPLVGDI